MRSEPRHLGFHAFLAVPNARVGHRAREISSPEGIIRVGEQCRFGEQELPIEHVRRIETPTDWDDGLGEKRPMDFTSFTTAERVDVPHLVGRNSDLGRCTRG